MRRRRRRRRRRRVLRCVCAMLQPHTHTDRKGK